jgi:hypothetical protein
MLTRILVAAALSAAVSSPVLAQADIVCDQAAMTRLETDIGQFTDATRKDFAEKELAMAKEALAANDTEKCKVHMANALKGGSPD